MIGGKRQTAALVCVSTLWLCWSCLCLPIQAVALEDELRRIEAAFLYNFVKFINWPDAKSDDINRNVTICVLGENVFGQVLEEIVKAGNLKGVRVAAIKEPSDAKCHLAFLAVTSEAARVRAIRHFSSTATVTVSEEEDFLENGGNIQFFTESSRIRFSIGAAQLASRGITISSHMLSLAAKVIADS